MYDQLNLPNHAWAEVFNRRRALIENAYHGRPEAPVFDNTEDFLGEADPTDGTLLDPALRQFVAGRAASRNEILKQERKGREEKESAFKRSGPKGGGKGDKGDKPDKKDP